MSLLLRILHYSGLFLLFGTYVVQAQTVSTVRSSIPYLDLFTPDNQFLLSKELERRQPGRAPEFAYSHRVRIRPQTHGRWEALSDGNWRWQYRVRSRGAHSLNFGFTSFHLPPGAKFYLHSEATGRREGPFTPSDNEAHNSFWTPVIPGDEVLLELILPSEKERSIVQLELTQINHDFVGFQEVLSGSCNLDVVCGQADGWGLIEPYRDVIRSVAVYSTGGKRFCTGFLVNNTRNDGRPYFLTANHCEITANNAASLVVYWNFENTICREPSSPASGQAGNGDLSVYNTGAIFRAGYSISDFTLLELDDEVNEEAEAFFAGWNRQMDAPQDTVIGIHHPDAAEKRISFAFRDTYFANGIDDQPNASGSHLVVPEWSIGTTEAGSSGSPLFDTDGRARGQLHGGLAACGRQDFDSYGAFARSWTGGGTSSSRLSDWLDPEGTGLTVIDGREQGGLNLTADALVKRACLSSAFEFDIQSELASNPGGTVSFRVAGLPNGFVATFDKLSVNSGEPVHLTVQADGTVATGAYPIRVIADSDGRVSTLHLTLILEQSINSTVEILAPISGSKDVLLEPELQWSSLGTTDYYELQISTDAAFENVIFQDYILEGTTAYAPQNLERGKGYYWRVRGENSCGVGEWSAVASFTTGQVSCPLLMATDLPISIPSSGLSTNVSTLFVDIDGTIQSVAVYVNIEHTWIGDLEAQLISPTGTVIGLFDRPGHPEESFGCSESNIQVYFTDDAVDSADLLEVTCRREESAISGEYQPLRDLRVLRGEPARGEWQLVVTDHDRTSGGIFRDWSLDFCADLSGTTSVVAFSDREVRLFPNPSSGPLQLDLKGNWEGESLRVRLLDASGRAMHQWALQATEGTHSLDQLALPDGIYFVELHYRGERRIERWIHLR